MIKGDPAFKKNCTLTSAFTNVWAFACVGTLAGQITLSQF